MIIGENINGQYDGYEEENYDYLFKRKSKEERQQKKTERKEKRTEKKQVRQDKRAEKKLAKQDPATGGKKKLQIFGNFGLFDKNKNKKNASGSSTTPGSSAKKEPGASSESSSSEESKSTPDVKLGIAGAAASASQDKAEGGNTSGGESGANTESANKEVDKDGNPKKEAGMGAIFGFVCLGLVVTVIGVVLFKSDKKANPVQQPLKVAA